MIKKIKNHPVLSSVPWRTTLRTFFAGLMIGPFLYGLANGPGDYRPNLLTEAMGIGFTVLVIDWINERRAKGELKRRLVRDIGSGSFEFAKAALSWLRAEDWHEGKRSALRRATLVKAQLQEANLENTNFYKADLSESNLKGADLTNAVMREVNLYRADLRGASVMGIDLNEANLTGAKLHGLNFASANLRCACLTHAQLPNAIFWATDLRESDLRDANLADADLRGAYLESAILQNEDVEDSILDEILHKHPMRGEDVDITFPSDLYLDDGRPNKEVVVRVLRAKANLTRVTLPDGTEYSEQSDMSRFTDKENVEFAETLSRIQAIRKNEGFQT